VPDARLSAILRLHSPSQLQSPESRQIGLVFPPQVCAPAPAPKANGIVVVCLSCRLENGSGYGVAVGSTESPRRLRQDGSIFVTH